VKALIAISSASLTLLLATPAYADLTSDLVARWTFNDCNGVDATGRGHDATLLGIPPDACVPGPKKQGLAFPFNGTNNTFVAPNSADFNVDTAVTYSAWINPARFSAIIFRKQANFAEDKYLSLSNDQRIHFYLYACMSNIYLSSAVTVPLDEWTHVAATYDGSFARIYINGQASGLRETTASCNVADSGANLYIGSTNNAFDFFQGSMDDVRVYQRTLTATEIDQLYRSSVKGKIEGTADWGTKHTVTCKNLTQGTQAVLPATKRDDWNCERADIDFNSGDTVRVIIDGTRQ
jgi:Concanavalin A-like lectin/glucanases superfamily